MDSAISFEVFQSFNECYNQHNCEQVTLLDWTDTGFNNDILEDTLNDRDAYTQIFTSSSTETRPSFNRCSSNNFQLNWNYDRNTVTHTTNNYNLRTRDIATEMKIKYKKGTKPKGYKLLNLIKKSLKF